MVERPTKGKGKCAQWVRAHVGYQGIGCLIWPYARVTDGYGQMGYMGKMKRAHVMMCELAHGPAPEGHEAAHNCGNGHLGCVHPKHLEWKTRNDNQRDRAKHNRRPLNGKPRLRPDQIRMIRQLKGQMTQQAIADRFGTSRTNVILIHSGQSWANVEKTALTSAYRGDEK
jgi:hypothetical protein